MKKAMAVVEEYFVEEDCDCYVSTISNGEGSVLSTNHLQWYTPYATGTMTKNAQSRFRTTFLMSG